MTGPGSGRMQSSQTSKPLSAGDAMTYDNILNALKTQPKLSPSQEIENYSAFSDLQKQGVYLPELMKKLQEFDSMKARLDELERSKPAIDATVFATMESAVSDDPDVMKAKTRVADEKARVVLELCMKDSAFREAYESYKATVNRVYVESKEKGADASQHLRRAHRVASANPFPISFKKLIPHKSGEELICHLTKDI